MEEQRHRPEQSGTLTCFVYSGAGSVERLVILARLQNRASNESGE